MCSHASLQHECVAPTQLSETELVEAKDNAAKLSFVLSIDSRVRRVLDSPPSPPTQAYRESNLSGRLTAGPPDHGFDAHTAFFNYK